CVNCSGCRAAEQEDRRRVTIPTPSSVGARRESDGTTPPAVARPPLDRRDGSAASGPWRGAAPPSPTWAPGRPAARRPPPVRRRASTTPSPPTGRSPVQRRFHGVGLAHLFELAVHPFQRDQLFAQH